jgi:hypothetical protein
VPVDLRFQMCEYPSSAMVRASSSQRWTFSQGGTRLFNSKYKRCVDLASRIPAPDLPQTPIMYYCDDHVSNNNQRFYWSNGTVYAATSPEGGGKGVVYGSSICLSLGPEEPSAHRSFFAQTELCERTHPDQPVWDNNQAFTQLWRW